MSHVVCTNCNARYHDTGTVVIKICPRCKGALAPAATRPVPSPQPLSLDDDDAPENASTFEGEDQPRSLVPLIAIAASVLILVGALRAAVWLFRGDEAAVPEAAENRSKPEPPAVENPRPKREEPSRSQDEEVPKPSPEKPAAPEMPPAKEPAKEAPPNEADAPSLPSLTTKPLTGEQVNQRLLQSTAFIVSIEKTGRGTRVGCGSGMLVHREKKLVVTNYHVVGENPRVTVFFPEYGDDKELITDPRHYERNKEKIGLSGEVVAKHPKLDLAILELDKVPEHVVGLPLAAAPAATGSSVYSLGGSGVDPGVFSGNADGDGGGLWRLTTGTVRGRLRQRMTYRDGLEVEAMTLETQSPVNPGDSGGPTVNDRGELVGVVCAYDARVRLVSKSIDLIEVRTATAAFANSKGWKWVDGEAAPAAKLPGPDVDAPPALLAARARAGTIAQRLEAILMLGLLGPKGQPAVPDLVALLEDPDERIRRFSADSLEKIGPAAAADAACVAKALTAKGRDARAFALRYFARIDRAAAEQLPAIVALLDDADTELRDRALAALENFGPTCKPAAFNRLFAKARSKEASFGAQCLRVLIAFAPYDGAEKALLVQRLTDPDSAARAAAATLLAPGAADESTALAWFEPLLTDSAPAVRAAALPALARWPNVFKRIQPTLVAMLNDPDPAIRVVAIGVLGERGRSTEVRKALAALLAPAVPIEIREAAAYAILKQELTDPPSDIPRLASILAIEDAKLRAAAFDKAASLGAAASDLLPQVKSALANPSREVKLAALRCAAAIGPAASELVPLVERLVLTRPAADDEPVQIQAAGTLPLLGASAVDASLQALAMPVPAAAAARLCDALGRKGTEVPLKYYPQLFVLAESTAPMRPALAALVGRIGGDEIARLCAERTFWSFKTISGKKVKDCKYALDVQVWAIEVMGLLDPKRLTEKGRGIVLERMKSLPKTNPDAECRKAAEAAAAKLTAAGLEKP